MMGLRGESMNPMTFGNMTHPIAPVRCDNPSSKKSGHTKKNGVLKRSVYTSRF